MASFEWFASGGFSESPGDAPLRVDASVLERMDEEALGRAFQVSPGNPLVGLSGRVTVLRRLGEAVRNSPGFFGVSSPRLGNLAHRLGATRGVLRATDLLATILDALGTIWPGRETLAGVNLGDVWRHSVVGRVPFHKLSQWLTYSLCEPLERTGIRVTQTDELTGLAEYRNGGLFVDGGVLVPKHERVLSDEHEVSSDVVIEWRALTVALLDRTAERVRVRLGLSAEELPLVKILEGGTWRAGREIAGERRADGAPPLRVRRDGTVF